MIYKNIFILLIVIFTAASCSEHDTQWDVSLIPFRMDEYSKWGYADFNGNIEIDTAFEKMPGYFREGYAIIETDSGVYDFIDENGNKMLLRLEHATMFSEGLACVVPRNECPCYIDDDMDTVFKIPFAKVAGIFSEGYAKYQNDSGKWGFIDNNGDIAIKPQFDFAMSFSEGLALVANQTDSGVVAGYIDYKGQNLITLSNRYKNLRPYREGLAAFLADSGWGFMDTKGKTIITPNENWIEVTDFFNGYASFRIDNYWGLINNKGSLILEAKYSLPLFVFNKTASFEDKGRYGYIGTDGKIIFTAQFIEESLPFFNDKTYAKNEKYFRLIDKEGNILPEFQCEFFNMNYLTLIDFDMTVPSDYYDVQNIKKLIFNRLDTNGIDNISGASTMADILQILQYDSSKILADPWYFYAELNKTMNIERKINKDIHIEFLDYPTDSSRIESIEYKVLLLEEGKGKEPDIIEAMKDDFMESGYKAYALPNGYFFEASCTEASLILYVDEIMLHYEFMKPDSCVVE